VSTSAGSAYCADVALGNFSPDGISVEECPVTSEVVFPSDLRDPTSSTTNRQECNECPYPKQSNCREVQNQYDYTYTQQAGYTVQSFKSCDGCSLFCLGASESNLAVVMGFLAVLFLISLCFLRTKDGGFEWKVVIGMLLYCAIPVMDTFTDLAFIMTNQFVAEWLLVASWTVFVLPNFAFFYLLYKRNILWPAMPVPLPKSIDFSDADNVGKGILSLILVSPFVVLNFIILSFKVLVGMYLYTTKSLCIGTLANWWFRWWTGGTDQDMEGAIDTEILNEAIYVEILFETAPQVVIQLYNNILLDPDISQWNAISLFSLTLTLLNTVNGFYRFFFFKLIKKKNLTDIPVELSILGYLLFRAELVDHAETVKKNIKERIRRENAEKSTCL
jgi:hypothetical protein